MIHQLRDKKSIARRKNITRNVVIVGVLFLIAVTGLLSWSGKLFNLIGRPIWSTENKIVNTAESTSYVLRTKSSVFRENELLQKENADMKNQMVDYQIVKSENEQLKELLGRVTPKDNFTLATILTKPNRSPYDTITIDVGSDVGIIEGLQVFANANVPIGEISKVYAKDSLVTLYSTPDRITAGVLDGSNTGVELVGRGGGNFQMTLPLDLPSENGKLVVLPNAQSQVLAIIDGVISVPTDPVKKVLLHSPINIQNLKWVQVKSN